MDGFLATIAENDFAKFGVIEIQSADSYYLSNVLPSASGLCDPAAARGGV
jgi:hypothetical protein